MTATFNPAPETSRTLETGRPGYVACNICGADDPEVLFPASRDHRLSGRKLGIVRCRACGLVYRNMREDADALRSYYDRQAGGAINPGWIAGRERAFAGCLKLLESVRQKNRILDVGAGPGFFLNACAVRGWECRGVELSRAAVDYARKRFGIKIDCGSFEDAVYPDDYFDAVTFFNSLEFMPDPKAALQKALRLLRPGGMVLVRFSNGQFHVSAKRLLGRAGRIFPGLAHVGQAVIHLYAFDSRTIKRLIAESGFSAVCVGFTPLGWTGASGETVGAWRRAACGLIDAAARIARLASGGRLMLSPALSARGFKR